MGFLDRLFASRSRSKSSRSERLGSRQLLGAFAASAVRLPAEDEMPEWLKIVPIGSFPEHHDGAHEVTAAHLEEMVANFSGSSTDLLFDFDHASVYGGSTRAAGWAVELEVREDGLYARMPEWTTAGQDAIASREYRYLSPVYLLESEDKQGQPAGAWLHSVALTNSPYFNEGEIDAIGNRSRSSSDDPTNPTPEAIMERDELIEMLGLSEDATEEEVQSRLDALKRAAEAEAEAPDEEDAPEAEPEPEEEGDAASDLEAKVNSLIARLDKQDADASESRATELVESAIQDGKIAPAQKAVYLNAARHDFEGTKKGLGAIKANSAMPSQLKLGSGGSGTNSTGSGNALLDYVNGQAQ